MEKSIALNSADNGFISRYSKQTGFSTEYLIEVLNSDFNTRSNRKNQDNIILRTIKVYFHKIWKFYEKIMIN